MQSGGSRSPVVPISDRRHQDMLQSSSRCRPPRAAVTQAMNAPIIIDKAVKIDRYEPALRAASATSRALTSAAFICVTTASMRVSASAFDNPVRFDISCPSQVLSGADIVPASNIRDVSARMSVSDALVPGRSVR